MQILTLNLKKNVGYKFLNYIYNISVVNIIKTEFSGTHLCVFKISQYFKEFLNFYKIFEIILLYKNIKIEIFGIPWNSWNIEILRVRKIFGMKHFQIFAEIL